MNRYILIIPTSIDKGNEEVSCRFNLTWKEATNIRQRLAKKLLSEWNKKKLNHYGNPKISPEEYRAKTWQSCLHETFCNRCKKEPKARGKTMGKRCLKYLQDYARMQEKKR